MTGRAHVLLVLLVASVLTAWAADKQRKQTVEVVAEVYGLGLTPEEAKREALQRARAKAVAQVTGIQVSAQQLRFKSERPDEVVDAFSSLIRTSTYGRIVREEVSYRTTLEGDIPVYRAALRAEVAMERGDSDPAFSLDLQTRPSSHTFRSGEPLTLELTASKDCYVTVLNIFSDGNVALLFPNERDGDNRISAGEAFSWPTPARGLELRATLREGLDRDREQLLAIATLDPVPLVIEGAATGSDSVPVADYETTLTALNRWLLRIPVDRRTEALWSYEIVE
jgi:hypothetical protein